MIDTPREDTDAQIDAEDTEFSNEHPLASPNELAGDAMSGVEMEFAARELAEAEAGALPLGTDATGAASGMALDDEGQEDTLPLEGN
ncbi:hypothetical protein GGQ97_001240 [Sphingomonas kaistensis]|uniref:Uncharacterized protein n=1 Tax=Sphingomonas kaistensis TaxID=298708 RepID=A0A7X5Y6E5_9SPHN|nr:hypothetical protein [Sphingomonas kaistensis]NJC05447.1 hypothetical protein [Sphingomonas kaistensis]